jgi:lysophospholipase L1-like esterase
VAIGDRDARDAVARRVAGALLACLLAACSGGGDGGGDRAAPPVQASVASMDAIGDSISKGFNAVSGGEICPESEIESRNFSTGDTHGTDFCGDGGEGVFSHAEQLECLQGKPIVRADPNSALSGARMLTDFADESRASAAFLTAQPAPRYVTILMGDNDVCAGTVDAVRASCPHGGDEDPRNHCRTTPAAFARELRRGLDALVVVPSLRIGLAAPVRASALCAHGDKRPCITGATCQDLWTAAVLTSIPDERGVCGSLTADCSEERVASAYRTTKAYRDVIAAVAAEYEAVPEGGATAGGATKAPGVRIVFSDAAWRAQFDDEDISCCDCFHPSAKGEDRLARALMEGFDCGGSDPCCADTGDSVADGRCAQLDTSGAFQAGFFPRTDR